VRSRFRGARIGGRLSDDRRIGWHVDRAGFDAALLAQLRIAGAEVVDDEAATDALTEHGRIVGVATSGGRTIGARFVVDATGRRAFLRRRVGARRLRLSPALIAWRGEVAGSPTGMDPTVTHFIPHADGWTFAAPMPGATAWTAVTRDGSSGPEARAWAQANGVVLAGRPWDAAWHMVRPLAGAGFIFAGDAAGRLDPASGHGLLLALWSGMNAARTARACLLDPQHEAIHLAAFDGWFADRLLGAAGVLRHLYKALGIALLAGAGSERPIERSEDDARG